MFAALQGEFGRGLPAARVRRPSESLFRALVERGQSLALAESCTGGLAAKWITDLPGASRVFWGGVGGLLQ